MGIQINGQTDTVSSTTSGGSVTLTSATLPAVTNISATRVNVSGASTFTSGPVLIGSGTSTGTASQPLQVTGGTYVSGAVGIGTTNPQEKIHLTNSLSTNYIRLDNSSATAYYGLNSSGDTEIIAATNNNLIFKTFGTERGRFNSSGNLGIGTAVPSQKLEVVGGEIKAGRVDSSYEGGQVTFGRSTDNASAWYIDVYGNTSTPSLRFVDVSTASVRMSIDSSGRVTMPYQPYAIISLSSGNVGAYNNKVGPGATTVVGTNIVSNSFSLYSSSNGRFTAPVTGLYEFGFSSNLYVNTASNWIMFNTYKNGSLLQSHYSDKIATNWQYVTFSDKIVLNANDYVDLRLQTDTGTIGSDINEYTQINFRLIG